MNATTYFESQLVTDANHAIDNSKSKFNHYDVIRFAEFYHKYKTENEKIQDMNLVFIYHKNRKIKVLDLQKSKELHNELVLDGWIHTQTLNTCIWIEYLFNDTEECDMLEEVRGLSMKPH